jgi:hypothetical protein
MYSPEINPGDTFNNSRRRRKCCLTTKLQSAYPIRLYQHLVLTPCSPNVTHAPEISRTSGMHIRDDICFLRTLLDPGQETPPQYIISKACFQVRIAHPEMKSYPGSIGQNADLCTRKYTELHFGRTKVQNASRTSFQHNPGNTTKTYFQKMCKF